MPCQDMHDVVQVAESVSESVHDESQFNVDYHQDHDNSTEHCSPFCICACCGQAYSAYSNQLTITTPSLVFKPSQCEILVGNVKGIASDFWQPPRIS